VPYCLRREVPVFYGDMTDDELLDHYEVNRRMPNGPAMDRLRREVERRVELARRAARDLRHHGWHYTVDAAGDLVRIKAGKIRRDTIIKHRSPKRAKVCPEYRAEARALGA
jgi:hypothetical protein